MSEKPVKRFYKDVSIAPAEGGYEIRLDDRPLRSGARSLLIAPTEGLANAIRTEWAAQGESIDRAATPKTALLSAAIDGGEAACAQWRQDILDYLGSDLLCYRAEGPDALAARQAKEWDPYLDWLESVFDARLSVTAGVVAVSQPEDAVENVALQLAAASPAEIFALRAATALAGSAVLALALWRGDVDPAAVFAASRVDEAFQAEKWGVDAEAEEREAAMGAEFVELAAFLKLLRAP